MTETKVREQYNRLALIYDQRWSDYIIHTLSFLKTWVQISPTASLLDIACGTGEFERLLLVEHPTQQIVGVDISEKMLAIARQKCQVYPNVSFQVASATALPLANNSFDVIVSANAFHYFDNPDLALREMKRVLKPEGTLVILDWCRDYLLCKICDLVLKVFEPAYKHCYTQAEFHHLLEVADFEIRCAAKIRFGFVWGLMVATAIPNTKDFSKENRR
jgi:ubiquinone/menaquinone biosynthesis C-methylase UbiE